MQWLQRWYLLRMLKSDRFWLTDEIRNRLSHVKYQWWVPALIDIVSSNSTGSSAAVVVLGEIGDQRAVEPLCSLLMDEQSAGHFACNALVKIGDARAVDPLIKALGCKSVEIRRRAIWALAAWKTDKDPGEHTIIEGKLTRLPVKGGKLTRAFASAMSDSDRHVRWSAAAALAEKGIASAVPVILGFAGDIAYSVGIRESLTKMLMEYPSEITGSDLERIAELRSLHEPFAVSGLSSGATGGYGWGSGEGTKEVDCSKLRLLAKQALARRNPPDSDP